VTDSKPAAERLGLDPMRALELKEVSSTDQLLRQMGNTAFTGRQLGAAAEVMEEMIRDDAFVVLTLSGAMTMAGLGRLIIEMLERRWVNCVVSTGALVGHGLVEDLGMSHYKADPQITDDVYFANRLNRVYDTIEPEQNLDRLETKVRALFDQLAEARDEPIGSAELLDYLGEHIGDHGVLQVAHRLGVRIFIPAFTDCELGLDFAVHRELRCRERQPALAYDGFRDLEQFRALCQQQVAEGRKLGIFTIGGGVPRNWAQQVGPYADIRALRLGDPLKAPMRFGFGVRICPDPVHYGHLSGCTYSEGVTWGKFVPPASGGRYAEVLLDATVAWPLLAQAMIERGL